MYCSEKNGFEVSKRFSSMFYANSLEQVKGAEQNSMLQFLKKLKLHVKLISKQNTLRFLIIYDHLQIIIFFKSILPTGTSHWPTVSYLKSNQGLLYLKTHLAAWIAHILLISLFCPIWKNVSNSKGYVLTVPFTRPFKVSKDFSWQKKLFSIC